jgi:hypothetical protein
MFAFARMDCPAPSPSFDMMTEDSVGKRKAPWEETMSEEEEVKRRLSYTAFL